jgi:hypothetical protein
VPALGHVNAVPGGPTRTLPEPVDNDFSGAPARW